MAGNRDTDLTNSTYATVGGGFGNSASSLHATVGGGATNVASGEYATVAGGVPLSRASGDYSTVPGGQVNVADANYGLAAGQAARIDAGHVGTFVWDDVHSSDPAFNSTGPNQFLFDANGGVGINTNTTTQFALNVHGPIWQGGILRHPDCVFEPDYELESIEEHARSMWSEKHLPAVSKGRKTSDGTELVEIGSQRRGTLQELEKAHIYIEQLHHEVSELETAMQPVEEDDTRIDALEARLHALERLVNHAHALGKGGAR